MSIPNTVIAVATRPRRPVDGTARRLAIAALTAAGTALTRLAETLGRPLADPPTSLPRIEFHAEAGCVEGAIYCDGVLVARIPGVRRL